VSVYYCKSDPLRLEGAHHTCNLEWWCLSMCQVCPSSKMDDL